jgi:hypothetical protein
VAVGQYEFIYDNTGYSQVGQDYGGRNTDVSGNTLFVRQKSAEGCNSESWTLVLANLGEAMTSGESDLGYCYNGVSGQFQCDSAMSNSDIAQSACLSVYDSCSQGSCGYFYYWYDSNTYSCNCDVPYGQYEFIYTNAGYSQVGQDYGGQSTDVSGNDLFVRMKNSEGCNGDSWALAYANLGDDIVDPGFCNNGAGGSFPCDSSQSNSLIARHACESVYTTCDMSSCGYFYYWHTTDTDQAWSCDCNVPVGQYEFIYQNDGYSQVGQDYGGQTTSVEGNQMFVRRK